MPAIEHAAAKALIAVLALAVGIPLAAAQQPRFQRPAVQPAPPVQAPTRQSEYPTVLAAEAKSRQLCEAAQNRIFVQHDLGSECIAFYATGGRVRAGSAVLFFDGDVAPDEIAKSTQYLAELRPSLQRLTDQTGMRIVFVARPGVFGSSGNHGHRRSSGEMVTMNAAVDALKARLGLSEIVLAGQSGGSTISAALLTLGRRDVTCAVLGSGSLSVVDLEEAHRSRERLPGIRRDLMHLIFFDPSDRLDWIERDDSRRIFVLGDPKDVRTPFPQQRAFADRLRNLGHRAIALEVTGLGEQMHGVTHHALRAAAHCARGDSEAAIRREVGGRLPRQQPAPTVPVGTLTSQISR